MIDADAEQFLLALLKSFEGGSLQRSVLLAKLAEAFPGVNWEGRMIHAEALFIRSQPGPALPDWLR